MNPYEILGVTVDAKPAEIKRKYRRKAMKTHPDQGGDPQEFRALALAYAVLSDPLRRQRYDQTGETELPESGAFQEIAQGLQLLLVKGFENGRDFTKVDLVGALRAKFKEEMLKLKNDIAEYERRIKKLQDVAQRLIGPAGEENLLARVVLQPVRLMEASIRERQARIQVLTEASVMLEGYTYSVDPQSFGATGNPSGWATTGTFTWGK